MKDKKIDQDLKKGLASKKWPYNPGSEESASEFRSDKPYDWIHGHLSPEKRASFPRIGGNARQRALHKLSGLTATRVNDEGRREFLLHRGISVPEKNKHVSDGQINYHKMSTPFRSWTPHYDVANDFAYDDSGDRTISAWVDENDIHAVPFQTGVYRQGQHVPLSSVHSGEKEIIVSHSKSLPALDTQTAKDLSQPYLSDKDDQPVMEKPNKFKNFLKWLGKNQDFLLDYDDLEKSNKLPHFVKFMGDHPKAGETAQWADDNLKHRNLAEFAMRHAKSKPEGLSDEEKTQIKHYSDSLHMPEVKKAAGSINKNHDYNQGIGILKNAEDENRKNNAANAPVLVPNEGEKVLDLGDGHAVYNLGSSKNQNEAKALGHCATPHQNGQLWSIRKKHDNGMVEPLVTISHEDGYIGEMKGKSNYKPASKYHVLISKLLASDLIKGFVGGGYAPESNFEISDLKQGLRNKLLSHKPSLVQQVYKEHLPEGFQGDYSHTPEIKSIFKTDDIESQLRYIDSLDINSEAFENVAKNATRLEVQHKIFEHTKHDPDSEAIKYLSRNPDLHPEVQHKIFEATKHDPDSFAFENVAKNTQDPELQYKIFEHTKHDPYSGAIKDLAQYATHPELQHKIFELTKHDPESYAFENLAHNIDLHPEVQHKIFEHTKHDPDSGAITGLASNKNLHPELQHKIFEAAKHNPDSWAISYLALNKDLHPELQHKIFKLTKHNPNSFGFDYLASNKNLHPEVQHKIFEAAKHDPNSQAIIRLAKNATHPEVQHKIFEAAKHDPESYAIRHLARNPGLHPSVKEKIARPSEKIARPLKNENIQKLISMMNNENDPKGARKAHEELTHRREDKYDRILSPEGNINDIKHLAESHDDEISKRARKELERRQKNEK